MPTISAYQRWVIKGKGIGGEIWQVSFCTVSLTAITSQAAFQTQLNALVPYITTWWNAVKATVYTGYSWTDVVGYQYQAGTPTAQYQAEAVQTPNAGTLAVGGSPMDTACVVSLRTAVPGRRTRGRMYVPFHQAVQVGDANFQTATSAALGTATKALFVSIINNTSLYPSVISRVGGTYELVTQLVTDSKPDVQRRRENKLAPTNVQVLAVP